MSEQNIQTPRKALNKAYLKVKPCREQVEIFKLLAIMCTGIFI